MKALLLLISTRFLKLVQFFAHGNRASEQKFFGLGQFVVLLTIAPFIFNLSLYSIGETTEIPSHYEYNPNRFEPLPALQAQLPPPAFSDYPIAVPYPKTLPKKESRKLKFCNQWSIKTKKCNTYRAKQRKLNDAYIQDFKKYLAGYKQYLADSKNYKVTQAKYQAAIISKYRAFQHNQPKPSPLPPITIKQYTNPSYMTMLEDSASKGLWQQITFPLWVLGALLILPTILLCIRRKQWGLLAFGLSVPALNYCLSIPTLLLGWEALDNWQITSTIIPQIAFCWFVLKGQMRSKSFAYFILLMVACACMPPFLGDNEGYSIMKALLPLLVFMMVAAIARLFVKGARENAYLLQNLGWSRSLRTGLRAIVLWLPMAALAIPFLYLTEVLIPNHTLNYLHQKQVLAFNHNHDLLDNALQSTARKTDDIFYAWHINIQSIKKDIYDKKTKLTEADLEASINKKFDDIVPNNLVFEAHESDAPLVGFIVDLSVSASQSATNQAYETFRQSVKNSLAETVSDNENKLKGTVNNNVDKAFEFIDIKYQQGKQAILKANHDTQTSLWWSIGYLQAAHQITLLLFAFVCIKSFMYVFARVSFNRDTGTFVTLGNTKEAIEDNVKALIKPAGQTYLINSKSGETFYISRRFQCRGKAPKFSIPQPFYSPIARLMHGAYTMNKIDMQKGDDQVSCSATKGMEFFEWQLEKGETIILDYHHFVGMSGHVKVSTLISPRISSLLLGKMIFSQATGPGTVVLVAKGRAEVIDNKTAAGSLPPERLIAMHKNTRLHIDSELDFLNIYLSTAYIRPAGGGKIIVDVDSQRGAKTGLASFIKHFILPV